MPQRHVTILAVAIMLLAGACGSGSDDADNPASGGGIGGAIEVVAGAPGGADDAACLTDRQTLASAVEMFYALNGVTPTSQDALVEAGMIKEPSPRFDVTADGALVPAPGSPCT